MIELPLSAEEFRTKADQLAQQQGINLPGTEGTIDKMGVKAGYRYADGVLTITILDKPFFLSVAECEQQLKKWLATQTA